MSDLTPSEQYRSATTVAEMDGSKYPAIVHRQVTDEIDRLKPKVEAESSQPRMIWIWWSQLVPGLLLDHKPINRDAVRELGAEAYQELVFLESALAEWLAANLGQFMDRPKGYKDALKAARAHLSEIQTQYRAATA